MLDAVLHYEILLFCLCMERSLMLTLTSEVTSTQFKTVTKYQTKRMIRTIQIAVKHYK